MKRYYDIKEVWSDIEKGITIHWQNDRYKLFVENEIPNCKYQQNHFTNRNGKLLAIIYTDNYFGCLMAKSKMSGLYSKGEE